MITNYSEFLFEERASAILYKFLMSNKTGRAYILPANICPIVPTTFMKAKVAFEFVDIDPDTLCLDEAVVLDKVTNSSDRYGGLLFNHTYGVDYVPSNLFNEIKSIDPTFYIIDDKCACSPHINQESITDLHIDLVIYSTGYAKYVDVGFGGFGFLKSHHYYDRTICVDYSNADLQELSSAHKSALESQTLFNYRDTNWLNCGHPKRSLDEYLELTNSKLREATDHKRQLNAIYTDIITKEFQYKLRFQNWRFNIRVTNKNEVLRKIFEHDLFASSLYHSLGEGVFVKEHYSNAVSIHARTINLFNDLHFTEDNAVEVCKLVNTYARWGKVNGSAPL